MKNLYQYSAEKYLTKFIWKGFNKKVVHEQQGGLELQSEKIELRNKVETELTELNKIIDGTKKGNVGPGKKVDVAKVLGIFDNESDTEKFVERKNGSFILKDRNNNDKIKFTDRGILKVKNKGSDRDVLKVDTKNEKVLRNEGFEIEKKEVTPETDASKEFKKKIETLDGNIEGMQEADLVSLEAKINALRTEIKDNTELTEEERTHLLGLLDSLTARIAQRREALKGKETGNETMKEYERKISGLESRLSGAEGKALEDLKIDAEALKKEINGVAEEKLSDAEKKTLTARIDSLIKNIEAKKNDLEKDKKREVAEQSLKDAQKLIDAIDITKLNITNYKNFSTPIEAARQAIKKADDLTKENFPDLAEKIPGLEAQLDKKENQVELYKTGATEKENVEKEYQEKTDEQLTAMDKEIKDKVDAYAKELEGKEKKLENLTLSSLTIDQTKEPQSYEEIQKGMQAHRLDSMMMIEEVNFLQECGQTFAEEIADFEEEKSAFTFPNIARSLVASVAILPGTLWDLGEKALGTGKRAGDRFGWLGFGDSRAEELQKKQVQFEADFTAKQGELETKKTAVDTYGDKLQINSETLKNEAPTNVQTTVQEKIAAQMAAEGIDPTVEPWKGIQEKLAVEFQKTAVETVQPAVDQLDMMVDGSVPELKDGTDTALNAASATVEYIEKLDIHSATVLDMSIGFLTKNVAKGLDGVGDVLASNPVTGVLGGVFRAAGGLVEGVGTLITDPDKVAAGLGSLLVGYDSTKDFFSSEAWFNGKSYGDAWNGLFTGFLGVEAFKTGIAKLKEGGFMNVIKGSGEIMAGLGEAGGNIVATVFTGGTVAGVRSGGILGKIGSVGSKISRTGVAKVARYVPESIVNGTSRIGRFGTKVGKFAAKGGDLALSPLRIGLRPLRSLKVGRALERGLTPTRWAKNGNIRYLRTKRIRLWKSSKRMERLAKNTKNKSLSESYLKEANRLRDKANKIDVSSVAKPKVNTSRLQKDVSKAEKALKKSDAAAKKVANLEDDLAKAQKAVTEAEKNVANAGKRSRWDKLNPRNKNPQKALDKAKKDVAKIEKDITKNKELIGDRSALENTLDKSKIILEKTKGKKVVAQQKNIDGINSRINAKEKWGTNRTKAMEDIRKLEAENIKLSKAMESHAKNIEKGETYIAEELAAGRKPTVVRNVNKKLEARYNELKHNHTQNTAEISSQQNIINEANFQIQNLSKNAKVNSPIKPNRPKTSSSKGMNNMENVNKWYNKKSVRNTAGIATMAAIPASYATAEMEKNKTQKIKEDIPSKTEFEPTPLVDLDGSPASVNGAPASGPQQTLKYEIADKKLFEDVRKDQLESFFKTKNTTDEANIKADILNYSAQDVEVVIDGVSGKTLTDIWDLKGNGKVLAFSLDSKMGKDNEPDLTKIDIKTT